MPEPRKSRTSGIMIPFMVDDRDAIRSEGGRWEKRNARGKRWKPGQ